MTSWTLDCETAEEFAAIRPGRLYSDVDSAVRDFFERLGLMKFWRHHVGHNLGLEIHEAPFFDLGDSRVIVLVTADGVQMITTYPRDLQSLVCT